MVRPSIPESLDDGPEREFSQAARLTTMAASAMMRLNMTMRRLNGW